MCFNGSRGCEVIQNPSEMPKPADLDDRGCYKEHHESEGVCPNPVGERGERGYRGCFFSRGGKVSQIISTLCIEGGQKRGFWRAMPRYIKPLKSSWWPSLPYPYHRKITTNDFPTISTCFHQVVSLVNLVVLDQLCTCDHTGLLAVPPAGGCLMGGVGTPPLPDLRDFLEMVFFFTFAWIRSDVFWGVVNVLFLLWKSKNIY